MLKDLTVQIVGWNSSDVLPTLLPSVQALIRQGAAARYIDNGSADNSTGLVRDVLPGCDIIALDTNVGFTGGHNIGFAVCETSFVLVVNPDITLDAANISQLLVEFRDKRVAAVQGKTILQNELIDSTGIIRTITLNGKDRGAGQKDVGQFQKAAVVDATTGALSVYRMSALHDVAHGSYKLVGRPALEVFDRSFFAYKEDVDLGWRLQRHTWKNLYVPIQIATHARHLKAGAAGGWGIRIGTIVRRLRNVRTRYSLRNYIWMVVKNGSIPELLLHELFIDARLVLFFVLSLIYPPLLPTWGEAWRGVPEMLEKRKKIVY